MRRTEPSKIAAVRRTELGAHRRAVPRIRRRPARTRPWVVVLGALTASAVAGALAAVPASAATYSYQAASGDIANPDRGLFHYTETHFRPDGSGPAPLSTATLIRWRTAEKVTVVYRIYYLEKYVTRDQIDLAVLKAVGSDLSAARAAGVKLIVRFAYTDTSSRDATPARVVLHIRQLTPVLNAGADVIATLQAGFIGRWGEWYYTASFAGDPGRPWMLTAADWRARQKVLDALLGGTSPSILVQVRYPSIKQRLVPDRDPRAARVGIHDDCFLADSGDAGTFAVQSDRAWLARQSASTPMGGETCQSNAPRSSWASARNDLAAYHWSYLNADFDRSVLDSWGAAQLAEVKRRLGYRLRLTSARLPLTARPASTMTILLAVANDGFAAPVRKRPVNLVLRGRGVTYTVPLAIDPRAFAPGRTTTVKVTATAPRVAGTYSVYLALPDPARTLASNPAYSIQLANVGTWVAAGGLNSLQRTIRIA